MNENKEDWDHLIRSALIAITLVLNVLIFIMVYHQEKPNEVQHNFAASLMKYNSNLLNCADREDGEYVCFAYNNVNTSILLQGNCLVTTYSGKDTIWCSEPKIYSPINAGRGEEAKYSLE